MAKGLWSSTTNLIGAARRILAREQPATIRQLFYRLVSIQALENSTPHYHKLIRVMTLAREREAIPFEWIGDRSRPTYAPNVFDDLEDGLRALRAGYRRDCWQGQPSHVEVWAEKDAITGAIQPVADELGVTIRVSRGFTSTTRVHEIASEFAAISMPVHVYYLGDHDPSGRAIERDLCERISSYGGVFSGFERLAILGEDIRAFDLPPLRVKASDSRAAGFRRKFGNRCVELDALPPGELRRRIRKAIESHIDWEAWSRALAVEEAEKESIENFVGRWKAGRNSVPVVEESAAEARPRNEVAPMGHVSAANIEPAEEIRQAAPALFEAISDGKTTLAQAGCKVKEKRKAPAISRFLAEHGLTGLLSEKEAQQAMALASVPKDIFDAAIPEAIETDEAIEATIRRLTRRYNAKRRGDSRRAGSGDGAASAGGQPCPRRFEAL